MKNKKILSLSLLAVMILSLLMPFGSAFAYTGGLLNGTLPSTTSQVTGTLSKITDNITTSTTDPVFRYTTGGNYSYVEYNLGSPKTVDKILLSANSKSVFTMWFYDSSHTLITNIAHSSVVGAINVDSTIRDIPDVANVQYVKLSLNGNSSLDTNYYVNEFDLFQGAPSVTHTEITNLVSSINSNTATLTYDIPTSNSDFTGSKIYRDGVLIKTNTALESSFQDNGLAWNTTYSYKVSATYSDGFETTGITSTVITGSQPVDPTTIAPNPVIGLTSQSVDYNNVVLTWNLPTDSDLSNVLIYKNDVLIDTVAVTNTYTVTGLSPETQYKLSVALKDSDGNIGQKSDLNITTLVGPDIIAPDTPTGLTVTTGDSALFVQWKKVIADDFQGYNIYVDGVKYNDTLYKNDFITLTDLTNGTAYSIQVSSVDTNGNESSLSTAKIGTPKAGAMPVVKTKYDLSDVAFGVSQWFESYWLIIAFASAIPLSFYIASRVKLMFIE